MLVLRRLDEENEKHKALESMERISYKHNNIADDSQSSTNSYRNKMTHERIWNRARILNLGSKYIEIIPVIVNNNKSDIGSSSSFSFSDYLNMSNLKDVTMTDLRKLNSSTNGFQNIY